MLNPCPIEVEPLPLELPHRQKCSSEVDELCFDMDNAWLLDSMIEALWLTYQSAKRSETCTAELESEGQAAEGEQ